MTTLRQQREAPSPNSGLNEVKQLGQCSELVRLPQTRCSESSYAVRKRLSPESWRLAVPHAGCRSAHPAPEVEDAHAAHQRICQTEKRMRLSRQLWCAELRPSVPVANASC